MTEVFSLVDYLPLVRELRDDVIDTRVLSNVKLVTRLDAFLDASKSEILAGDTVLAQLYCALDSCGLVRTETQRFFHKSFVLSALPWIYGKKDFSEHRDRVLAQNGVTGSDKYNQFTLISTPRLWGKTTSVALFCAAMLYTVPDAWISVYSTGKRASKSLSDMVAKFIIKLEEGCELKKSNFIVRNQEELHYAGPIGSDIRRMYSYPATVQVG
jgi:hypothetical protein